MSHISDFTHPDKEILILLGAGASIDAGIPSTYALTKELYSKFKDMIPQKTYAYMFAYVVSGIQQYKTTTGYSPFDPPNIEEIISAIQLIANRQKLEADPFIATWDQKIHYFEKSKAPDSSELSRSLRTAFAKVFKLVNSAFVEAIESFQDLGKRDRFFTTFSTKNRISDILSRATNDLDQSIRSIENSLNRILLSLDQPVDNWKNLYQLTHTLMTKIMWLDDPIQCLYLKPLLNLSAKHTHLLTLNYDTSIELLAKHQSISLSDGFDSSNIYRGEYDYSKPIHYLKLHGSINWHWSSVENTTVKLDSRPEGNYLPSLIICQREKLRSQGPFLDLFM